MFPARAYRLRLDILEVVDRKLEWLYGRTFMKLEHPQWLVSHGPQDMLVDRYANPWDSLLKPHRRPGFWKISGAIGVYG